MGVERFFFQWWGALADFSTVTIQIFPGGYKEWNFIFQSRN